ncbi:MAG: cysteine desulfurase [Planctomycetia bacterium]|nr:cysteine desulfurase [Planctomycetia bacterium]
MNRASRTPAGGPAPAAAAAPAPRPFDPRRVRAEFPILARAVRGKPLVYLDNAATTQKPVAVLEALDGFYRAHNANIHRAVHTLSQEATLAFDAARETVRRFLNAADAREVIFTRGTTEGINLVAQAWGRANLRAGDEVLLTTMEHHSNIVPWQLVAAERGAVVRVVPIDDAGTLDLDAFHRLLGPRTRLVAVGHVSNALGTVNPVADLARAAHAAGALVLVDGAQAVAHARVDVRALDADFYAFSGHKVFGPTGIGALYGKRALLEAMPPWQGGGDMIRTVSFAGSTWADLPSKFEAGTPDVAGAVGLGAALAWFSALPFDAVAAHEADLLAHGTEVLSRVPGLRLVGTSPHKASVLSFTLDGVHPHDIGTLLDLEGVAVRTGHHCAQPVMERYGVPATARASLALYNLRDDLDALVAALAKVRALFPL